MTKISLRAARVNAGYNQKDAAKILGISNSTLGSWEHGRTFPTPAVIEKICRLYGLSYDDIIFCSEIHLK